MLTSTHLEIIDTQIWQRTGVDRMDVRPIVRLNCFRQTFDHPFSQPDRRTKPGDGRYDNGSSLVGSFRAYKGKIFLLVCLDQLRFFFLFCLEDVQKFFWGLIDIKVFIIIRLRRLTIFDWGW